MDICLFLNNTEIQLTQGTYTENRNYVDNQNKTESGKTVRELIRSGIIGLSVSLICDSTTKQALDAFADEAALEIAYWSEKAGEVLTFDGFIDGYKGNLKVDASERFYEVSFDIKEL